MLLGFHSGCLNIKNLPRKTRKLSHVYLSFHLFLNNKNAFDILFICLWLCIKYSFKRKQAKYRLYVESENSTAEGKWQHNFILSKIFLPNSIFVNGVYIL